VAFFWALNGIATKNVIDVGLDALSDLLDSSFIVGNDRFVHSSLDG
jgi:hypothetical protein